MVSQIAQAAEEKDATAVNDATRVRRREGPPPENGRFKHLKNKLEHAKKHQGKHGKHKHSEEKDHDSSSQSDENDDNTDINITTVKANN